MSVKPEKTSYIVELAFSSISEVFTVTPTGPCGQHCVFSSLANRLAKQTITKERTRRGFCERTCSDRHVNISRFDS